MTQYSPSLISWYFVILVAGLLGLPWTFRLFRRLPDRGYAFSKTLGLLISMFLFWLLASWGIAKNDNSGLLLAVLIVGACGYAWLGKSGRGELREWIRAEKSILLAVELFFLICFVAWAWVRSINPDIYGTEKPMELMFINSILRSPTLPPHDAWLSGQAISYYYFGYFIMAALTRITAAQTEVAYNLAHALIFALTAAGSLGLVLNLIALVRRGRAQLANRPAPGLLASFWPALLGPLMILLVANFHGFLEILHDNGALAQFAVPAIRYDSGSSDASNPAGQAVSRGITAGPVNFWTWLDIKGLSDPVTAPSGKLQWSLPNWFYASRVIHDRNLTGQETEAIDEMPAFSFLLADLHPHVLALPFVFLAIILALDWLLYAREASRKLPGAVDDLPWPSWDRFLLTGVILGALLFLNTWDFPIYWFLTILAVAAGIGLTRGTRVFSGWWGIVRLALGILGLSVLLYLPFFLSFESQAGGILPNIVYPSRFQQTVVMFGPVLLGVTLFSVWLSVRLRSVFDRQAAWTAGIGILLILTGVWALLTAASVAKTGVGAALDTGASGLSTASLWSLLFQRRLADCLTALFGAALIGLVSGVAVGVWKSTLTPEAAEPEPDPAGEVPIETVLPDPVALDQDVMEKAHDPAIWMAVLMVLTGALLLVGPEYVYLRDNFGTRMNTLFKFYFQIWVLWGSVAAFGTWYLLQSASRWARGLVAFLMGIAVMVGLVYLPGGLAVRTNNFTTTPNLNGLTYFSNSYPADWAAIQWLDQNAKDGDVILEGSKGAYWSDGRSSRFSMITGLSTVIGWVNHEAQWRGDAFSQFSSRDADVRTIYQTRDWTVAKDLLDRYQVDYVIVSSLEDNFYHPIFTQKFDAYLHKVFESGDVVIYAR